MLWLAVEDYVGPDGVARERRGVIVSLLRPSRTRRGAVLPHERTHARPKEAAPAAARDARPARADLPALRRASRPSTTPSEPAGPRGRRHAALARRGDVAEAFADRAAPDRRRPPPLRERRRARAPRTATAGARIMAARRRPTDDPGLDDLPDPSRVRGPRPISREPARGRALPRPRRGAARVSARAVRARGGGRVPREGVELVRGARASSTSSSSTGSGTRASATRRSRRGGRARSTRARPTSRSSCARPRVEDVFDASRAAAR